MALPENSRDPSLNLCQSPGRRGFLIVSSFSTSSTAISTASFTFFSWPTSWCYTPPSTFWLGLHVFNRTLYGRNPSWMAASFLVHSALLLMASLILRLGTAVIHLLEIEFCPSVLLSSASLMLKPFWSSRAISCSCASCCPCLRPHTW